MKETAIFCLLVSLFACSGDTKKNTNTELDKTTNNSTKIETFLQRQAPQEAIKLEIGFKLYDDEPLEQEPYIVDKLNAISDSLFSKYGIAKESDTIMVHVWRNYDAFLEDQLTLTGTQFPGSGGYIFSPTDLALLYSEDIANVAEHEFVHASSLSINDQLGHESRWLWEAFAIYEADELIHPKNLGYLRDGKFPSIAELNGEFDGAGANRIYQVGYVLSEFVVETWGNEKYLELIQESADLEKVLSMTTEEFEIKWQKFVKEKYLAGQI
jgi:hypothetical protein